jgi:histidinol phosphatase-like enzyme
MTKLIIFDKDGTLTEPISGGTFVQHPQDQRLRPGVAGKLEQLRSDGVMLAIASNQGGCAVFEVMAEDIKPGMSIEVDGQWIKVDKVRGWRDNPFGPFMVIWEDGRPTGCRMHPDAKVKARYKSIDDAYAEMEFALQLTGIEAAFFCPDMAGEKLHIAFPDGTEGEASGFYRGLRGKYRKPEPGMLLAISTWAGLRPELMVGDRAEDKAAAEAAGFAFEWVADYFGGTIDAE